MREAIKDWRGKILGFVEVDGVGNKVLRDFHGHILGKYDKSQDVTRDFHGRKVAQGDCLMTLLK